MPKKGSVFIYIYIICLNNAYISFYLISYLKYPNAGILNFVVVIFLLLYEAMEKKSRRVKYAVHRRKTLHIAPL